MTDKYDELARKHAEGWVGFYPTQEAAMHLAQELAALLRSVAADERERCAVIAETHISPEFENAFLIGGEIADVIRGEKENNVVK